MVFGVFVLPSWFPPAHQRRGEPGESLSGRGRLGYFVFLHALGNSGEACWVPCDTEEILANLVSRRGNPMVI